MSLDNPFTNPWLKYANPAEWPTETPEQEAARKAEEEKRAAREAAQAASNSRRAYLAVVRNVRAVEAWDLTTESAATRAVADWLGPAGPSKPPPRHLVLRGGVGCGKTTAACVAVKRWLSSVEWVIDADRGRAIAGACWLRPNDVVSAVFHSYDESSPKLKQLVVVDDMGLETKPDFGAALCELLDTPGHTLLITTNLTKPQFRDRYDARLLDRLNHTAVAVDLPAQSMRRQDGGF